MHRVNVYCRARPPTEKDRRGGLSLSYEGSRVHLAPPQHSSNAARRWEFDTVFGPEAEQQQVYDEVGTPILEAVMEGYNGTILAYGQTGSGKTHTLLNAGGNPEMVGLVPRLVASLFVAINTDVRNVYTVRASFAQIYNEQIDDLLRPRNTNLKLNAGGNEVQGLSVVDCKSAEALMQLFEQGRKHLVYAETKLNKTSSRSHAVLQLHVA